MKTINSHGQALAETVFLLPLIVLLILLAVGIFYFQFTERWQEYITYEYKVCKSSHHKAGLCLEQLQNRKSLIGKTKPLPAGRNNE